MSIPVLLDEHVEPEVYRKLQTYGHDVEHVLSHDTLRRGDDDQTLAAYSLANEVLIVTYDDDFHTSLDETAYWGVLVFSDNEWSATDVADTIHQILQLYDEATLSQLNVVGREWL